MSNIVQRHETAGADVSDSPLQISYNETHLLLGIQVPD